MVFEFLHGARHAACHCGHAVEIYLRILVSDAHDLLRRAVRTGNLYDERELLSEVGPVCFCAVYGYRHGGRRCEYLYRELPLGGHAAVVSGPLADRDGQQVAVAHGFQVRAREFRGVALVVSVVLVEREFAAAARKEGQQDLFVVRIEILHRVAVHGQDGARTYVNRIFVQRESPLDDTSSVEHRSGLPLIPFPLGEPDLHGRIALLAQRGDRRYEDVVAEEVLVAEGIGFRGLGPLVVHRPAERNPLVVGLAGHGVDVGCERVTPADGVAQDVGMLRGEVPDLLFQSGALGRVGAHDGAQGAELHPADVKFGVDAVGHVVSSDVVAPISVEDVRGRGVEVGLEVERSPRDGGVARKSDLIAVVAQPAPAVVEHRSHIAVLLHVAEKYVVEPPCVAQSLDGRVGGLLLPVEPPEIHPVALHRRQDAAEDAADEFLVGRYPGYGLFRRGVDAHVAGNVGIAVLTASHAVGRMEVEGRADALPVEPPEELRRIGKERAVP